MPPATPTLGAWPYTPPARGSSRRLNPAIPVPAEFEPTTPLPPGPNGPPTPESPHTPNEPFGVKPLGVPSLPITCAMTRLHHPSKTITAVVEDFRAALNPCNLDRS